MTTLSVALGSSAYSNVIDQQQQLTLHDLARVLHAGWHWGKLPQGYADTDAVKADKDTCWFSLARFRAPVRNADNVESVTGFVGDFDKGTWSPDEVATVLTGFQILIYTTYSNSAAHNKFRLVVPYTQPVSVADHGRLWHYFNDLFEGALDGAAKDAPRLFYFPSSCPDAGPPVSRFELHEGAVFDPGPVLANLPQVPPGLVARDDAEWTDAPRDSSAPIADDELVRRMLDSNGSPETAFNGKPHIRDLLKANVEVLARAYPSEKGDDFNRSKADQALANTCIFWTRGNCEQTERIMRGSDLMRDKYDRTGYLRDTILKALADHTGGYYGGRQSDAGAPMETTEVQQGASVPPPPSEARIDHTDKGNANLLIRLANGDLRYVAETKQWLRWSGARWQIDTHEVFVTTYAVNVAEHYFDRAKALRRGSHTYNPDEGTVEFADDVYKWASKCRSKKAIDSMISLARKAPGVPISLTELDRNPWLLGVENGVVDLRTGQLRETEAREDYVTRRCQVKYNPDAPAPRWEQAIAEITGAPVPAVRDANGDVIPATVGRFTPRPALAHYLHKALGYSLTGSIQEQKFFIGVGAGSNGKGVVFDTILDLLGPYAFPMPSEMFMATKNSHDAERPTALAASLAGVRLVVSSETKEGQKLDVAVVKSHTGDSKLTARKMRSDPVTFTISHKPWLLTNAPPGIDHIDPAIRGRLHLIPFDRRWNRPGESDRNPALPDGDKGLMAYLRTHEVEGVLAWLVRGARLYQSEGLVPPTEVVEGTRQYFNDQDALGLWLGTLCRCQAQQGVRGSELFLQFATWCAGEGREVKPSTQTAFGKALDKREIESVRMAAGVFYGVRS